MSPKLRAVVIEDEPHARELLREILNARGDIDLVAESVDGAAAVRDITSLRPDLIFLDVQMPELDGFEVLEQLEVDPLPAVIFVTAFDQYALRAFDVHAIDYLLKPFDAERVDRAVSRAMKEVERVGVAEMSRRVLDLVTERRERGGGFPVRIPIKGDGRVRFVDVAEIDWIHADDHVLRIHAGREVHDLREALGSLEERLDPARFVRVHRAAIVSIASIREVQTWFRGDYVIVLKDGTKVTTGRTYRDTVRRLLEP